MLCMKKRKNAKKFTISAPENIIDEVDKICDAIYMPRSGWILQAIVEKMERIKKENEKITRDQIIKG